MQYNFGDNLKESNSEEYSSLQFISNFVVRQKIIGLIIIQSVGRIELQLIKIRNALTYCKHNMIKLGYFAVICMRVCIKLIAHLRELIIIVRSTCVKLWSCQRKIRLKLNIMNIILIALKLYDDFYIIFCFDITYSSTLIIKY